MANLSPVICHVVTTGITCNTKRTIFWFAQCSSKPCSQRRECGYVLEHPHRLLRRGACRAFTLLSLQSQAGMIHARNDTTCSEAIGRPFLPAVLFRGSWVSLPPNPESHTRIQAHRIIVSPSPPCIPDSSCWYPYPPSPPPAPSVAAAASPSLIICCCNTIL